jgi:hypothetical protein
MHHFLCFLLSRPEQAYFIDLTQDTRPAVPVQDHHEFRVHWREGSHNVRLFIPREAVAAIAKLLSQ